MICIQRIQADEEVPTPASKTADLMREQLAGECRAALDVLDDASK